MTAAIRPMTLEDVPAVARLQVETFVDLDRRCGRETAVPEDHTPAQGRIRHLIGTDPGGAWVAEEDGVLRGAALALVREDVWGLSLLVVSPSHQSAGIGRSLLRVALDHGIDAAAGIVVASEDSRALRAYHRAGFDLRPTMDAAGPVKRRPPADRAVREGRWPEDRELVDTAGRFVRGAGHGREVPVWRAAGGRLYVHESGGFAVRAGRETKVVAARDADAAAALLRAALRDVPAGEAAEVASLAAGQEWAVATVLDAGLGLRPSGALMVRGAPGPLAPYLPSGAYL